MKKKCILTAIYLLGWLYPLSIMIFNIADHFLKIDVPDLSLFDFNNDAMIGYVFYGVILALISFFGFYIVSGIIFDMSSWFYLSLLNPVATVFTVAFGWNYQFAESPGLNAILLIASLLIISVTLLPLFKAEKKKKNS